MRSLIRGALIAGVLIGSGFDGGAAPSPTPTIGSCPIFPEDNAWNVPVDRLPVHPHSSLFIQSIGATRPLHPDFGSQSTTGIPYNVVSGGRQTTVVVPPDESDLDPVPMPANPLIEGGTDRHLIVIDQRTCRLHEFFLARRLPAGGWAADSAAYFDLRSNALRPAGWTSADAAGLPLFAGLVRHEEVAAGEIRHALRFSAPQTRREYVWPARHFASRSDDSRLPPMGLRVRLRADFNVAGFTAETQVILRALKTYGMMLADNGSPWFITGAPHPDWDAVTMTTEMRRVTGADFEAVDQTVLMRGPNSAAALRP